ncbi:probable LRR receptor-like serine/threonine-protein kinase At4g29180 isoform X2 [Brachypodium distachyon]|uniref:Protein kinase domain-containing protein n=1 Tax=Brachypodium distachyon TaxID=15368 RepID=A0A0Q3EHE1_BRADI|nr:probable LRR receptor-like serine/threonine-protein kinase At4g29180 isoform X2 [Brachypodium distachyon]KQJ87119.1 hypothetical protein BRADI_4g09457v3 [Brachypodium distachyon]KQJ87138.1 hypothetical protein BRADI_4g09457v3 [Brachypodium distachyon]KQJ87150.1 hypothetical protein BRADI_4g09457v3 [Brachypodium distachyon]PNT62902.1 hypothetical protein BRADI_4g09457v3 [Brachypodium distachyon]|eukprot:XP_024310899.1 probable LRR receptor-like serine/threonine-protein kinase At4g29180 isoform X2 [Brachypodium distachyon]
MESTSNTTREFTLRFLQDITNNFSQEHIIGSGGYGVVYRGVLENGDEIAIKKLHNMPGLDDTQFRNEFNNLMRAQHQNITRLVGYCYHQGHERMKYNGEYIFAHVEERALCFEYLQGGSLDKYISDESRGLDWCTRYKIIKGVCEGLNYLHNGYKDPIYHMDLKPANILLDKDMTPKIGDFGLSRLFPSANTFTTIKIIGTPGYMPPEYIEKHEITPKFDVFSLGVIIIRVVAGDEGFSKSANMSSQKFVRHVHENWRKRFHETMSSHTSQEVMTCIEIALRCVEADRVRRPTISDIVIELNKIHTVKSLRQIVSLRSKQAFSQYSSSTYPLGGRRFSYKELKRITNNFNTVIGRCGFGFSYVGRLEDGTCVTVKIHSETSSQGDTEFLAETQHLARVHHRNLVSLIGYCKDNKRLSLFGKKRKQLSVVYEYMDGGNLHDRLTGKEPLSWLQRLGIALDSAYGLEYLHKSCSPPLIHRDVKAVNILLTRNLEAKLSGFGLTKAFSSDETSITTQVAGTIGYLDPEYFETSRVSEKTDVYSFGVVLLILITGQPAIITINDSERSTITLWVRNRLSKGGIENVIDPTIQGDCDVDSVWKMAKLALRCTENVGLDRPTMTEVVERINESLLLARRQAESPEYDSTSN